MKIRLNRTGSYREIALTMIGQMYEYMHPRKTHTHAFPIFLRSMKNNTFCSRAIYMLFYSFLFAVRLKVHCQALKAHSLVFLINYNCWAYSVVILWQESQSAIRAL